MVEKKDRQEDQTNPDSSDSTSTHSWEDYSGPANSAYKPEEYNPDNPNHQPSSSKASAVESQTSPNRKVNIRNNVKGESGNESAGESDRRREDGESPTSKDSAGDGSENEGESANAARPADLSSGSQVGSAAYKRATSNSKTNTSGGKGCGTAVILLVVLATLGGIFVVNRLGKHESKSPDPITVEETTTVMHTETETETTEDTEPAFSPPSQASYVGTTSSYRVYKWGKTSDEFADAIGKELDSDKGSTADRSPSVYSSVTGQAYTVTCESQRGKGWYCYTDTNANVALVNR